ncbi:MAG: decaprenyl-phosphate phosphoribosyltransferase [Solirubrobacteraceae bacterium]
MSAWFDPGVEDDQTVATDEEVAPLPAASRTGAARQRVGWGARDALEPSSAADAPEPQAGSPHGAAPLRTPASQARALWWACRPRQWLKNVLVLVAPAAAGVLTHERVAIHVALAFACFCMIASCGYIFNDLRDREEDARHRSRRRRPLASGELSPALAAVAAVVLGAVGVALAFVVAPLLGAVAAIYLLVTVSYSRWLRAIAVADIVAIASCFVLRALAGGAATGVPVSRWFVMVASFGALFLVSGKRYAELRGAGASSATRAALSAYSKDYLRFVMVLAASVATATYCLWAFQGRHSDGIVWYELTVAPFVLGLLRYGLLIDQGAGEAPEELVLADRFLLSMGISWVAIFACAVYVGT